MFTGIIEEIGIIKEKSSNKGTMIIQAKKVLEGLKIGDSVSVNGVCLTVAEIKTGTSTSESGSFKVDVMPETLKLSNLGQLQTGMQINLERAMQFGDRIGGHLISGHIDGTGKIVERIKKSNSLILDISTCPEIIRYIIKKGSIAIDGMSLTVADVFKNSFRVCLIPHTLEITTIGQKEINSLVNLEIDMIGKYVERFVSKTTPLTVDLNFLADHGFV